jgi:glutathione S-transferase
MDKERILYGFWLSPYMSMVAQILEEAGLPYRYERVSPFIGQTGSEEHKSRNPLGKIPALAEPNGVTLAESMAICRYLARTHDSVRPFYPCDDPLRCAEVDRVSDFLSFSVSGPFFTWFLVGGYMPKAWEWNIEKESEIFSHYSMVLNRMYLGRMIDNSAMSPFLLGDQPTLPDFHLFHILELGKTFSAFFDMPFIDLAAHDGALQEFYQAMLERPSTIKVIAQQESERELTRREIFEEFGNTVKDVLVPARQGLSMLFGHEV